MTFIFLLWPACSHSGETELDVLFFSQDEQGNSYEHNSPLQIYDLSCVAELKYILPEDIHFDAQIFNVSLQEELFSFSSQIIIEDHDPLELGISFLYEPEEGYPVEFLAQTQLACIFIIYQGERDIRGEQTLTFE